ncbi:MAG: hypothetical protein AAGB97_09515 [Dehalococcoidia bacterium]|nr:hypothetical protein [Chloroflexota bacterium]MBT9162971.1 hypothetical protein [Chloroflexota bacterium]
MITGKVTANREAVIELEVVGSNQRKEKVEAVIDTGFNGYLNATERFNQQPQTSTGWQSTRHSW